MGRVFVEPDLSIPGYPHAFVVGDAAHVRGAEDKPLPAIAPAAIQQGKYVAKLITSRLNKATSSPFRYFDKGSMATIGKAKAIATLGRFQMKGLLAWLAWGFIHIFYLVSFEHRALVMLQWVFWYVSGTRHQRLILQPPYYRDESVLEDAPAHKELTSK